MGKADKGEIQKIDYEHLFKILAYSKNYEADLNRGGSIIKNYRFYNEREWRFVPNKDILGEAENYIAEKEYNADKEKFNNSLDHIRLTFETNDISYIIVKCETDIKEITQIIRNLFSTKCTMQEMEILLTRIITTDQIRYDI